MLIPPADRLNLVGEYFFSKKLREVAALRAQGRDIINLGIGSPDMTPSNLTIDGLCEAASEPDNHGYQPYNGTLNLRAAFAAWYKRTYKVTVDPASQVLPLLGSKEGIFHTSMAFLNPGDQVLIPDPGYPSYAAVTQLVGAEPVPYDLSDESGWLPDLHRLAKIDLSRVKLMWANYPHMPTGALATQDDLQKLVDFARDHQILLCHDNPYSLILNPKPPLSILSCRGAFECCIELNSLSKSHNMAGWRVGMVVGAAEYLQPILNVKSNMDSGMFLPVQKAAIAALKNSSEWHREQNLMYRERRKRACELMRALNCTCESVRPGLFVWANTPDAIADIPAFLDQILYEAGVFLTPGIIFGNNGARYVRASLCVAEEVLSEAVRRIKNFMETKR